MQITSKGQVTIPREIREELGLLPNTEVEFDVDGSAVRIRRVQEHRRRGSSLVGHMRGRGTVKLTTGEIMALTRGDF